jgi:hypothetical protein
MRVVGIRQTIMLSTGERVNSLLLESSGGEVQTLDVDDDAVRRILRSEKMKEAPPESEYDSSAMPVEETIQDDLAYPITDENFSVHDF